MPAPVLLITGAAGNLGRKLATHFQSEDCTLVLLDAVAQPAGRGVEIADLSRWDDWSECFRGVDCVIHLAGDAKVHADWESVARNNIDATLNVFEAASRHGVKRVVFASSVWVMEGYGKSPAMITEDLAPLPVNAYGASKLAGERIGRSFSQTGGLSVICFRIGACFPDPDNRPGLHLGGSFWAQRKWLSNGDLCRAFELAINAPRSVRFEVFNLISQNQGMRWDMTKAERVLGFRPEDVSVPVAPGPWQRFARRLKKMFGLRKMDLGPRIAR